MRNLLQSVLSLFVIGLLVAGCAGAPAAGPAPTATALPPTATPEPPTPTITPLPPTATPEQAATASPAAAGDASAPAADGAAADAIRAAVAQTGATEAYRVDLSISGQGGFGAAFPNAPADQEIELIALRGAQDGPASQFTIGGLLVGLAGADPAQGIEVIVADNTNYIRGPVPLLGAPEARWYILEEGADAIAQPPLESSELLDAFGGEQADLSGFSEAGNATIDGQSCTIYAADRETAIAAFENLDVGTGPIDGQLEQIDTAEFEFGICPDGYVHQLRLAIAGVDPGTDEPLALTMQLQLSDFDGDITITPPEDAVPLEPPSFMPQNPTP